VPGIRPPSLPVFPTPRVDLTPYINGAGGGRGVLYLNDAIRASGVGPGDYSPHDFRLSPSARFATMTAPGHPNPMVNRGICEPCGNIVEITMSSTPSHGTGPIGGPVAFGIPPTYEPDATVHAWDLDGEGYGNPRILNRSGFTVGPEIEGNTEIDLGADECDELIMGGFIEGTRVFSFMPPGTTVPDHRRVFFFNLASTTGLIRPHHNAIEGKNWDWWPHVQGAPDAAPGTNYTTGMPGSLRAFLISSPLTQRPAFMRNLECDVSPSLLSDPHAKWTDSNVFNDIYAANPWWWYPAGTGPQPHDNGAVYDNVNVTPPAPHGSLNYASAYFSLSFTPVLSGTLNPPGSLLVNARYLDPYYNIGVFAYGPCSSSTTYSTDAWGIGDTAPGCPDFVPMSTIPSRGVRLNCQIRDYTDTFPFKHNLQTFRVFRKLCG
jgi:hypothetical protein